MEILPRTYIRPLVLPKNCIPGRLISNIGRDLKTIFQHLMIGPNVTIITAGHPIEPTLRRKGLQFNKDVHIGDNAWIGAGVIILPGVHIGKNSVVGAGSVVTKDIPGNVVAVGNPCRVLREIGERAKQYYYKDEKIDWHNLTGR
jgi:galactoside O-acetyltransferase